MKLHLFLICICFCLFLACTENEEEQPLLRAPEILESPNDMDELENGIDAVPQADAIQVQWINEDIYTGYQIHRKAQDEQNFTLLAEAAEGDSAFVDTNIELFKRYYYYLTGFDDNQSMPSDTVNYMLVTKAYNLSVSLQQEIRFHWQLEDIAPDEYILKLFKDATGEKIWFSRIQSSYQGMSESVVYNWDGTAAFNDLERGVQYRWRIDIVGPANFSGSESAWHRFIVPL